MAYTGAITDIGSTLVNLLTSPPAPQTGVSTPDVGLYSPGDVSDPLMPNIGLFLYYMNEDPSYVNQEFKREGDSSLRNQGVALELFYLVVAHSTNNRPNDRAMEEHGWLGQVMQLFHDNTVIDESLLPDSLANKGLKIKITLNPVPLDDLTKIWQALQVRPFKLSVCYRVGPVFIESDNVKTISRVKSATMGQE
jgi:hypothetical protein